MNRQITLTEQEKFMNMAKLGTVSRFGNYCADSSNPATTGLSGLMAYTLCEVINISTAQYGK